MVRRGDLRDDKAVANRSLGPPGVGKTLTAESVAKSAGKPLLSIGVSDIGLKSDVAEKNLRRVFDLATEWEAVILLDEADVFLNSRGQGETNLEKNALVSVLLRVLEYYEGILILTTNRINSFDVAVQSRVHLAVKYQNLDAKQINKIYTTFLQQIKDENNIDDWKAMQRWVAQESKRSDFNGRQIRNIVSAALGLARAGNEKLNTEHLDEIVEKTTGFHKELERQRQAYEAKQLAGGQWEK
jgi:SpoVK/Ycf46/Vps4 family AAA+-type ATPase